MSDCVILVEDGVQDQEYFGPYYIAKFLGWRVTTACLRPVQELKGKFGIKIRPLNTTGALLECMEHGIIDDVVIVPGGFDCPEKLRQDLSTLKYLQGMRSHDRIIAAICHGPWVLASAGLCKGRRMTCYKGMRDDLVAHGAEYVDAPVVEDGNIITSPHYDCIPEFMKAISDALRRKACQESVGLGEAALRGS